MVFPFMNILISPFPVFFASLVDYFWAQVSYVLLLARPFRRAGNVCMYKLKLHM